VRAKLEFHGLVPSAQLASTIARHDLGLALEQSSIPSRDLTITNKVLQYLNAGLAVVATDTAGQREVLRAAPDIGLLLGGGDPRDAAVALRAWLADRPRLQRAQRAARAAAENIYSWEREAPRLLGLVGAALAAT
jgi:glycosyltransferase involved in cell wall biosynthesis